MKTTKMSTIVVLALGLMVWPASVASGAQYLTVNGEDVNSITLEPGQSCTVEVVSDDYHSYVAYVGFDNGQVLGNFSHLTTEPNAGALAAVIEYNQPAFYGYYVNAAGTKPAPSPGVHFVFEYEAQEFGETDVVLKDYKSLKVLDSVQIRIEMGTAFTYQGRLIDSNTAADGVYDFEFKLYDDPNVIDSNQVGSDVNVPDVDVIEGYFTVELDFGSEVFDGDARWLETAIRPGDSNDVNDFVTLSPRQEITPVPYALQTRGIFVDNAGNVGIGKTSPADRLDVAGHINSNESYKLDGETILANLGARNIFVGENAGVSHTTGSGNTFLGNFAGYSNTTGSYNTFVGRQAGRSNTEGTYNTFLGIYAGSLNTTGRYNTFVGESAGGYNTTGIANTFLGLCAGRYNTTGRHNTFLGSSAGLSNTTGALNVFIGHRAGQNETGSNKLYIANGRDDANVLIYGDFSTGNVGIGTTSPGTKLEIFDSLPSLRLNGHATSSAWQMLVNSFGLTFYRETGGGHDLVIDNRGNVQIPNGNVGIGTKDPRGKLDVNGSIYQRGSVLHADYVFEPGYELESIDKHSEYMWQNKHLSAIPKAKVDEAGKQIIEVGAHRRGIVEELEKAHIYIEQLHKQNKALETRLVKLEAVVARLNVSQKGGIE